MSLRLRYAVRSDRGLVRTNNEDSVYAGPRLLAVADGMGGHAAGEVASNIVIGILEPLDEDRPLTDLIGAMRDAVAEANAALAESVSHDPQLEGMGTTLTAIRFAGARIALVHVGDSRAYLLRGDQLSQITHDDTYVQSLVDSGKLTPEEASSHPRKSVILRALTGAEVEPDISIREARVGDRYLLCSDGLSDVVSADTLLDTMAEGTPQGCADRLIELALRGGGPDNVTCIVADVVDAGQAGDDLPVVGGAVVDPSAAPAPAGPDSPAMRASRIGAEEPLPATLAPRRRSRRRWLLGLLAAAVLIGGAIGGYAWTQSQFFVGRDGTEVALFHGINADFGPFSLYSVVENTDLKVNDLQPAARSQVANGIAARDRQDGDRILARLSDQLLPPCPTVTPTPTVSPPTATATRKAPLPVRTSTGRAVPRPTATAATRSAIPSLSATLSAPGVTPSPSLSPAECRS